MEVSRTRTAQNVYSNITTKNDSKAFTELPVNEGRQKDSVKISREAKALSQNNQGNKIIQNQGVINTKTERVLPLEAFALPGWSAELLPDYNLVDTESGISYKDSNLARFNSLNNK